MAIAFVEDVYKRLPPGVVVTEDEYIETLLNDAETKIKVKIPDLEQKVADNELSADLVRMIEAEMVKRVVMNPEGFTQEADGNYSYSISRDVASGLLEVTDEEWAQLGVSTALGILAPKINAPWCHPSADPAYWFQYYTVR